MGKIYPDLAGAYRRKVGGTVYYMRFGENIVRRKAVPNENRKGSVEQEKQQQKFTVINMLGSVVKHVVDIGFPQRKRKLTGVNMFVHINREVWQELEDEVAVDFTKLLLARGSLYPPTVTADWDNDTRSLTFTYQAIVEETNAQKDDIIYGVIIDAKNGFCRCVKISERAKTNTLTVALPDIWDVNEVQVYAFALSSDKNFASKSVYIDFNP